MPSILSPEHMLARCRTRLATTLRFQACGGCRLAPVTGGFPEYPLLHRRNFGGRLALQTHGLFGSISTTSPPVVTASGVVNAASFAAATSGLAPGSIAVVFGSNLTEGISACIPPACTPTFRSDNRLNTTLAGAEVEINGVPAPMFYASPTQLAVQIPVEATPRSTATLQASVDGEPGATIQIPIGAASPGLFFSGTNVGVITHANGTLVTTASPAVPGETVSIYATGLGAASPVVPTGVRAGASIAVYRAHGNH